MNNNSESLTIGTAEPELYQRQKTKEWQRTKKKKTILILLLGCTLAGNMLFTNVAALLPPYAKENRPIFSSFEIGCLFASY